MHDMHETGGLTDKLIEKGYRLTPQRLMIVSAMESSHDHISAEEIYAQVAARYPNVNISTIYRTLELLKKLNLIYETEFLQQLQSTVDSRDIDIGVPGRYLGINFLGADVIVAALHRRDNH